MICSWLHSLKYWSLLNTRGDSIVIFIAGLLLSGIITILTNLAERARLSADQSKLDLIKTSLVTFIAREKRLPCPAIITLASGAAGSGVEAGTPGTCDDVIKSAAPLSTTPFIVATGAVPWATLGISEESTLTGNAHRLTYQVTLSATNLNSNTVSGMLGRITIHSAAPAPGTLENQTNNCLVVPSTINPCAAVAVIVSHGPDGYGAYTSSGTQIPFPTVANCACADARENANADSMFVVKGFSGNPANLFDDKVLALTVGDLLTPLSEQGVLKDWRAQFNEAISRIKFNVIADAYNAGASSSPPPPRRYIFPTSVSYNWPGIQSEHRNDPWGNPYVYNLITGGNIECLTVSETNVFSITSRGPDGVVATSDDISVVVSAAEIKEIIAKAGCNN